MFIKGIGWQRLISCTYPSKPNPDCSSGVVTVAAQDGNIRRGGGDGVLQRKAPRQSVRGECSGNSSSRQKWTFPLRNQPVKMFEN
jgi:hypothetical protein